MKLRTPLLFVLCMAVSGGIAWSSPLSPVIVADDFSRYPEGSDAATVWDTGAGNWKVHQRSLVYGGEGRSLAIPLAAPHAHRMVVEAAVTMRRAVGRDWKLAGLTVVRDEGNYWHLALVEQPDQNGSGHFVELSEMRGGNWLSQSNLTVTAERGMDFKWQYDHPYRLRVEIGPEGITGTVSEMDGTERARKGYSFGPPAVTTGRPALVASGMAAGFSDFRAEIRETAPPPPKPVFPAYSNPHPGPLRGRKSGFFHVERIGGRWWIIDPVGRSFYAVGTDHVNYNAHYCEKLGYAPYHRNVEAKFGSEEKWAASAVERLKRWGFNTLGAGCSPSARHRGLVHTEFLSLGTGFTAVSDIAPRTTWTGFPDVFHPRFARWCENEARRTCAPNRGDPWLIGYFLDNELEWFGKNGSDTGLVDETFKKPAEHPAKRALVAFLKKRYPDIAAFNRAWGARLPDWEALAQSTEPLVTKTAAGLKDRRDFMRLIAQRYFAVTTAAILKADPNHMVLGCRFAGYAPPGVIGVAGRYCDIVSVNFYGQVDLERGISTDMPQTMRRYYAEAQRPLMLTEWSFPALDAGLPSQHGAGQRVPTQKDKARCYSIYQRALFSLPFMVGSDYFMWVDEPALGISSTFPEDSNYGLVDVNDNAWPELTQTAARVNRMALALHGGDTAELRVEIGEMRKWGKVTQSPNHPTTQRPALRVRNRGRRSATFTLQWWVQGKEYRTKVALAPGAASVHVLSVTGPAFVAAAVDPEESVLEMDRTGNYAEKVVFANRVKRPTVLVVNPSARALTNVPVSVALGKLGANWGVRRAAAQVDALPGGPEMALRVPNLPARSVAVLPLVPGASGLSQHEASGDRSLTLPGPLVLAHDAGSGDFFDRVKLGDLPLGRFRALVHQSSGQSLWVPPDRMLRIETWEGPVRTVLLMTAGLEVPGGSAAKTAVNAAGVYAPQERRAGRFRITFRLTRFTGESWFGARFLRLENTDDAPWHCAAYYHYPLSFIGGDAADDRPNSSLGSAPLWFDAKAGAAYGAVVDTERMRASFWKDTPDGPGEHPDIWRELNLDLAPGQAVAATAADPTVLLFGARGTDARPGGNTLERLKALARVRATLIR
jgi:hypothetical protein